MVHALIARGLAAEETVPGIRGIGRVCRIYARTLYRALGAEHIRHRRNASPEVLMSRLLSLDYVIEHPGMPWLATEAEKVAAFEGLGIERGWLPVRVYRGTAGTTRRYFPVKLPVALDSGRAVFVYADPGHGTATALRSWGAAHRRLWNALQKLGRCVEVVAVGRTTRELERARRVMRRWAEPSGSAEPDPEVREELARIERAILEGSGRDPRRVRRSPSRHEAERGAREAGPAASRSRVDPARLHMAGRAPRGSALLVSGGRLRPGCVVKTKRGRDSHFGASAIHTGLAVQPVTRQRFAPPGPCRPVPRGRHRPWR